MNKIKLLYDVVKTMKEKESVSGSLQVEGEKDRTRFLSLANDFHKNIATGDIKAAIRSEVEVAGQKVKHESTTEFNLAALRESKHEKPENFPPFLRHHRHSCRPHGVGIKRKLAALGFFLNLLDDLQIVEQEDQALLLTVRNVEIPEDWKTAFREKAQQAATPEPLQQFTAVDKVGASCSIRINAAKEIENIVFSLTGEAKDRQNEPHPFALNGELKLTW